jgi:hypothetical protein
METSRRKRANGSEYPTDSERLQPLKYEAITGVKGICPMMNGLCYTVDIHRSSFLVKEVERWRCEGGKVVDFCRAAG